MQIIRQLSSQNLPQHNRTVLTIGSYDGIHQGHKRILRALKASATAYNASTALITFYPRPKNVLFPEKKTDDLTTLSEKLSIFESLEVDIALILPFSREFSQTPAQEFIEQVVTMLHPIELWVGPDFKLGKDREGDITYLRKLGESFDFLVKVVDLEVADNEVISSTRIRQSLAEGHIKEVTRLLGDYFFLLGTVVKGAQRGRTIGFPTANIALEPGKLLPPNGVYAVWIQVEGIFHPGVANIGVRPTFNDTVRTLEVYIFDFDRDIYGQDVRVDIVAHLREEQKFDGLEALVSQIKKDVIEAQTILSTVDKPA